MINPDCRIDQHYRPYYLLWAGRRRGLPSNSVQRLSDVFDDEVRRLTEQFVNRATARVVVYGIAIRLRVNVIASNGVAAPGANTVCMPRIYVPW